MLTQYTFKDYGVGSVEILRDALFGNPPSLTRKPSREGVLAAFTDLELNTEAGIAAAALSGTDLDAAMQLVTPLLQSAQAAQAAANQAVVVAQQILANVPASVAAQLGSAVQAATAAAAGYAAAAASQIDVVVGTANALFSMRGEWTPDTDYDARDIVAFSGIVYFAVSDHTSDADFNADLSDGKWAIYQVVPDTTLTFSAATASVKPAMRGDGVDDGAGIQAALQNLALRGGGCLELSEGIFHIDSMDDIPSNVWIEGSGRGTILRLKNGANKNVIEITGTRENPKRGIKIANLSIDGNMANNSNGTDGGPLAPLAIVDRYWCGIRLKWVEDSEFTNLYIHDCAANGIQAEDSSRNHFRNVHSVRCGFDGIFFVNQSRRNVVVGGVFDDNFDIGISSETVSYLLPGGSEPDPDRQPPVDGDGASENIVMNAILNNNGGPLGWSPRMVDADHGLSALHSNRQVWIGNVIIGTKGSGIFTLGDTSGHIIMGNMVLFSEEQDLALYGTATTAIGNACLTSVGTSTRIVSYEAGQAVASVQNTNPAGYSNLDFYNSLNQLMGSIVLGNPSAAAFTGKFGLNAPEALYLFIGALEMAKLTDNGLSIGGKLGVGVAEQVSALAVAGIPTYDNDAAADIALGPNEVYRLTGDRGLRQTPPA